MKKTLDTYGVLFVYYTITKGDIMKNLTNYKIIKGKALVDYLMRFDSAPTSKVRQIEIAFSVTSFE